MNTMKGFYASISSTCQLHGSYQEALSKITRINRQETNALRSDLGWQQWSENHADIAPRGA